MAASASRFDAALEKSRVELLDLTLRNPLLKFRISTKRGLSIIDEDADQVFDVLVREKIALKFHHTIEGGEPRRKRGRKPKAETLSLIPAEVTPVSRVGMGSENRDDSLATPYSSEEMEERLLATWRDAELAMQERGANFLNAVIGHLEWFESDSSEVVLRAPLILVPVKLERSGARGKFTLRSTDEDPCLNIALAEKLKEFGIKLPPLPENADEVGVSGFLKEIGNAIKGRPNWKVDTHSMAIGFFSFGKFLMYRDLDSAAWPDWSKPVDHDLLSGLLCEGLRVESPAISLEDDLDVVAPSGETMEVVDCDGSQAEALAEVSRGKNLIVQGPPGTGKSQTITNMIAQAVNAGKRVLFIAEKMAALDVVKRRLDSVGLGDLCLELHSDKANKKAVIAQLRATMESGKPLTNASDSGAHLSASRSGLNQYAKELHTPIGASGLTPYRAIAKSEKIRAAFPGLPEFGRDVLATYNQNQISELRRIGDDLTACISKQVGVPAAHPYAEVGLTALMPGQDSIIKAKLEKAKETLKIAQESVQSLATVLELPQPASVSSAKGLEGLAGHLLSAPDMDGVPPIASHWDGNGATDSVGLATLVKEYRSLRSEWDSRVRPKSWGTDLSDASEDVALYVDKAFRILSGKYRRAAGAIKACGRAPLPKGPKQLIEFAAILSKEALLREIIEAKEATGRSFFGSKWKGPDTDGDSILRVSEWSTGFRALKQKSDWPESVEANAVKPVPSTLKSHRDASTENIDAWKVVGSQLKDAIRLAEVEQEKLDTFAHADGRVATWAGNIERLQEFTFCRRLLDSLIALGFKDLADLIFSGTLPAPAIVACIEWNQAEALANRAIGERQMLRDFHVDAHNAARDRFRKSDSAVFSENRALLASKHWESLPPISGFGQMGYLQEEFNRKRIRPIRKLMENAGDAVQAIKPVFMMSPLSISTYLPAAGPRFDLAIFDEASQVKPVDAFGAILRASQIVVVGDDKQMPPTAFFDKMADQGEDEDEDGVSLPDVESILGLCKTRGMRDKMLKWHYRSQHESLIAVSNQEFYRDLVVFPSPHKGREGLGLKFHHLPQTVYDKGGTRTNVLEAQEVAKAVLAHVRKFPDSTLGVVAFSVSQKAAIEAQVEALAKENGELDVFISQSHPEEKFFVKNLENVQGDERDFIFISVGYGKDADGRNTVNFGPVNSQGGERRLNVLISRARKSCQVFANIKAEDIDLSRTASEGVRVLKRFLAYAETGKMEVNSNTGREADSDFETEVAKVIQGMGYRIHPQVGCGSYRIDIGVMDPATPGKYLAGVECDGATYHSSRWARDRDRLREGWLRKQGWEIIRIWSTDWYRQRNQAIARLKQKLAESQSVTGPQDQEATSEKFTRDGNARRPEAAGFPKYVYAKLPHSSHEFDTMGQSQLMDWAQIVVHQQFPVHKDEVLRRIVDHLGQRMTESKSERMNQVLAGLIHRGEIVSDGDHYLPKGKRVKFPRDRSEHREFRQIEYVHDAELKAAILWVVRHSFGCSGDEASAQVIRLLGITRGTEASGRVDKVIQTMLEERDLLPQGNFLRANTATAQD